MATFTLQAPAPELPLTSGMKLRLEAINPTTGAAVAGVTVSNVAVYGTSRKGALQEPFTELPIWIPDEVIEVGA